MNNQKNVKVLAGCVSEKDVMEKPCPEKHEPHYLLAKRVSDAELEDIRNQIIHYYVNMDKYYERHQIDVKDLILLELIARELERNKELRELVNEKP